MSRQLATPAEARNTNITDYEAASEATVPLGLALDDPPICCAPVESASAVELEMQERYLRCLPHVREMLEAVSNLVVVLNRTRQIVFCNRRVLTFLGQADASKLLGMRLGDALGCIRAQTAPGGCGTCEFCKTCGARKAILLAGRGEANVQECHLTRRSDEMIESLELAVHATPLDMEIRGLVLLSLDDISHEKRRRNLEKIFFHDILNAMNGVVGYAELMREGEPEQNSLLLEKLNRSIDRVLAEIKLQRELLAAENNELKVSLGLISTLDFLRGLIFLYSARELASDRKIVLSPDSENISMETDSTLLGRVIGNMVKNALEACQPGERVTLGCKMVGDKVSFSVASPAFMPGNIQLQVFSRTFSTKGSGRGLGTYSMRLLSQRYLKGSVSFESHPDSGTVFYAQYPPRFSQ
jgi:signal transduction histidine kinase